MILFEITGTEQDPVYQALEISNGNRQYDFLQSVVGACIAVQRPFLSSQLLKALNFHAIACLHTSAGEYRPCEVEVGPHRPPASFRVQALMDDFINHVNRSWETADSVALATWVLWRLNHIHPFINGNGRTARAACYFVLCVKSGSLLPGTIILPELLRRNHAEYVDALRHADASTAAGPVDLSVLHKLLDRLILEQLATAGIHPVAPAPPSNASGPAPALPAP